MVVGITFTLAMDESLGITGIFLLLLYSYSCEELTHLKRPWCWERLKAGGEVDNRVWDGWMASLTQRTWFWVNSRSWWWTGRPGMLQFMGSQRVGYNWAPELNWTDSSYMMKCEHYNCTMDKIEQMRHTLKRLFFVLIVMDFLQLM